MTRLPGIVFIVDPKTEHIALKEAQRLKLPIVAVTDTNCDPDGIDFIIPANDDAVRSITLLITHIADACAEGMKRREVVIREETAREAKEAAMRPAADLSGRVREKKVATKGRAYVADQKPDQKKGPRKGPKKDSMKPNKPATEKTEPVVEQKAATNTH